MSVQTITTHPYQLEFSHAVVPTYNPKLCRFVQGPLAECMKAAYPGVERLRYYEDVIEVRPYGNDRHHGQAVIVEFENGYKKLANVEGDSEWGCLEDVMKCILR